MTGGKFMPESSSRKRPSLNDLQVRAAELRIAKVKAEKEAIDSIGKELSLQEKAAIEKRRQEILYQLELEGALIEKEFVETYRSRLAGLPGKYPGLTLDANAWCPFNCTTCISSCTNCVSPCPNCVTPCTNSIF
jgi:hypothetical protein